MIGRYIAPLAFFALSLAACDQVEDFAVSTGIQSSGGSVDGVVAQITDGTPGAVKNDGMNMLLFSASFNSTSIEQPLHAQFYVDTSPQGNAIRQKQQTIYLLVNPFFQKQIRDRDTGKTDDSTGKIIFPGSSGSCEAYYIALGPSNNYTVDFHFTQTLKIREKTSAVGGLVSSNWEMSSAAPRVEIFRSKTRPFSVDAGRTKLCYLEQTKALWGY